MELTGGPQAPASSSVCTARLVNVALVLAIFLLLLTCFSRSCSFVLALALAVVFVLGLVLDYCDPPV